MPPGGAAIRSATSRLDEQDRSLRVVAATEEQVQQRAGDVVRDVRDQEIRLAGEQGGRVDRARRRGAGSRSQASSSSRWRYPMRCGSTSIAVNRATRGHQPPGQHAEPGPDLHHTVAGAKLGSGNDRVQCIRIGQEVLAEATSGTQALLTQQAPELAGVGGRSASPSDQPLGCTQAAACQDRARDGMASSSGVRPARRRRSETPPPHRSWPRCRCTMPAAGRGVAVRRGARRGSVAGHGWPRLRRPGPRRPRHAPPPRRPSDGRVARRPPARRRRRCRPPGWPRSSTGSSLDLAQDRGLEAGERGRICPADGRAGSGSPGATPSAAAEMAGPPGYGGRGDGPPCRRPPRRHRRPSGPGAGTARDRPSAPARCDRRRRRTAEERERRLGGGTTTSSCAPSVSQLA